MERLGAWATMVVLPCLGACSSVLVGGAAGFDAGTLAVSGIETGAGGQAEVIGFGGGSAFGVGPVVEWGGYPTAGDADPIVFTTLETRFRLGNDPTGSGYLELGAGAGLAWSPGIHHAAVPLQVEVGLERFLGSVVVRAGVRERFIPLFGGGSPPLEAFNSVQLTLGVELGRSR